MPPTLDRFPRTEVRILVQDGAQVVVSRQLSRGRILATVAFALAMLVPLALDLQRGTVTLFCSRARAACTVATGTAAPAVIPLSDVARFTVRYVRPTGARSSRPQLLAETAAGEVLLVDDWSHAALTAHAQALNELLRGEARSPEWGFMYPRGMEAFFGDLPIFGGLFLLLCLIVALQLGWRTRLDRRSGTVVRLKPVSRSVRPLEQFRAVTVRSMADTQPARPAPAEPREMLEGHLQIALVDAQGVAWPITRWLTCPRDEAAARAAEVAAYLGLPVAAPQRPAAAW